MSRFSVADILLAPGYRKLLSVVSRSEKIGVSEQGMSVQYMHNSAAGQYIVKVINSEARQFHANVLLSAFKMFNDLSGEHVDAPSDAVMSDMFLHGPTYAHTYITTHKQAALAVFVFALYFEAYTRDIASFSLYARDSAAGMGGARRRKASRKSSKTKRSRKAKSKRTRRSRRRTSRA